MLDPFQSQSSDSEINKKNLRYSFQGRETNCNNMDPSGSLLVRRRKGVDGSGKLQPHEPLPRVADMTPVNGRIELRPRKVEGSLGVRFL